MKKLLVLSLICIFALSGCLTTKKQIPNPQDASTVQGHLIGSIFEKAKGINDFTLRGMKDKEVKYYIPIEIAAKDIMELSTDADKKLKEMEATSTSLAKELAKSKSDVQLALRKIWIGLIGLGALGLVAGIFIILLKQIELGGLILVGSGSVIGISYFILVYWWILAVVCGVALLGVIGYTGYNLYKKNEAIKISEKVNTELIKTVEVVKGSTPMTDATKIEVLKLQSSDTKAVVDEVKESL